MQSQAIDLTSSHWVHDGVWITVFKNEKAVEILCIFSNPMQSQAFSGILWADSRIGQVVNTLWRVWGRPSVAQPCYPCRHRLCAEKHMCPWLAAGMEHECNSPLCLQHIILCSSHPENALGWPGGVGDVKKVCILSYKLPVSQLDSRNMNVNVSSLKWENLHYLMLYVSKV